MQSQSEPIDLHIGHLFRHESGKMVAVLTRIFGAQNIDLVEDVVQDTLLKALDQWRYSGLPDNPQGWLYKVAKNKALDIIRRERTRNSFNEELAYLLKSEYTVIPTLHSLFTDGEIEDDQLRMMFVCCHPAISSDAQVALILKTLCGFSVGEIAAAFLSAEDKIAKRIYRAKQVLREKAIKMEVPRGAQLEQRLEAVLRALYLLFNEGYNSSSDDEVIRRDLINESLRLAVLLAEHAETALPQVHALVALILLHSARLASRLDANGNILVLHDQDRSKWDTMLIERGLAYLERCAMGSTLSIYHIQAAIAAIHCTAPSLEQTDWRQIIALYDQLYAVDASPVTALNRAIAIAELDGPEAGLLAIEAISRLPMLHDYHLLPGTLGELHARLGNAVQAVAHFNRTLELTSSPREIQLIQSKIAKTLSQSPHGASPQP